MGGEGGVKFSQNFHIQNPIMLYNISTKKEGTNMKERKYKGIKGIAQESKYCGNGIYLNIGYDPLHDKLISEEFAGSPSQNWVEWAEGIINIGVITRKMTINEIREMVDEVL